MTIWADILDDIEHNRSLADILRVAHDPEWDVWERHAKHNQKDHGKGGLGLAVVELLGSGAFAGGSRPPTSRHRSRCHATSHLFLQALPWRPQMHLAQHPRLSG